MAYPHWVYRFRNFLACPPLFFLFLIHFYEIEDEEIIWPLGTCIVFIGIALRIWALQHLHYRLNRHKQLTTTGPYQFVRNPLYIGSMMMCVGATVASELLWFIPVTIFWCIGIYSLVIHFEERHLLEKYGDAYRRYLLEVPRWLPKISSFKNMGLINEYLSKAFIVEFPGIFILLPCLFKEILNFD